MLFEFVTESKKGTTEVKNGQKQRGKLKTRFVLLPRVQMTEPYQGDPSIKAKIS